MEIQVINSRSQCFNVFRGFVYLSFCCHRFNASLYTYSKSCLSVCFLNIESVLKRHYVCILCLKSSHQSLKCISWSIIMSTAVAKMYFISEVDLFIYKEHGFSQFKKSFLQKMKKFYI